ncbi:unnamed protein product, partial [Thlaspi arvense]
WIKILTNFCHVKSQPLLKKRTSSTINTNRWIKIITTRIKEKKAPSISFSCCHHLKYSTMEAANVPSPRILKSTTSRSRSSFSNQRLNSQNSLIFKSPPLNSKSNRNATAVSSNSSPESEIKPDSGSEKFDWYENWYPVMPICDLDKKVPHGKKVMGIDLVVWWERNEKQWKVMDDTCPHRLAPLSDGRIDQWGRLQCAYHGWCFNGSGDCKLIPQAPPDGPPVHSFKQACVAVYPSTVQHEIVWFWPNTNPKYKNIIETKKPPYIPELEDPSFTKYSLRVRWMCWWKTSWTRLMFLTHIMDSWGRLNQKADNEFAFHKTADSNLICTNPSEFLAEKKVDREGGRPLKITVKRLEKEGFFAKQEWGYSDFIAPCVYRASTETLMEQETPAASDKAELSKRKYSLIFICIPVSPGRSRLILTFPRNFGLIIDKIVPRWVFHMSLNKVLDSDLHLLHVERVDSMCKGTLVQERKIMERGPENWQKACFYSGSQVDWRGKFDPSLLPPTPPREQLLDRYWSHVENCSSCKKAHRYLNALEVILQIASVALIGVMAVTKQITMSNAARIVVVVAAVLSFAASKWLSHFIYKTFHYHDYNHALV